MGAICEALKRGERFSFDLLWVERDELEEYCNWWWEENGCSAIKRPLTVDDEDPHLIPSIGRAIANIRDSESCFSDHLRKMIKVRKLYYQLGREAFREEIVDYLIQITEETKSSKEVVFLGGGYGAGKTVLAYQLAKRGAFNFGISNLRGVDVIKFFLPEIARMKAVFDGRGSEIVQDEARLISETLFQRLLQSGRPFSWDSSFSDAKTAEQRIAESKAHGYTTTLAASFVTVEIATQRAMERAKRSRRFPNPKFLKSSHVNFARNFLDYVDLVDKVVLVDNRPDSSDFDEPATYIAEKLDTDGPLLVHDDNSFNEFLNLQHA